MEEDGRLLQYWQDVARGHQVKVSQGKEEEDEEVAECRERKEPTGRSEVLAPAVDDSTLAPLPVAVPPCTLT